MLALPSETAVFLWPSKLTWSVGSITFSNKLKQEAENRVWFVPAAIDSNLQNRNSHSLKVAP